jgi:hypothetical protein
VTEDRLGRLAQRLTTWPWWLYNGLLVATAVLVLLASWALVPGPDEFVYFRSGQRFGDTCAFITLTGMPCPQCGMTRSFVYAARGQLIDSFLFSPGGLGLFLWAQVAGIIGLGRLLLRDPRALQLPWQLVAGWALLWTVGLYLIPYVLRLAGINPLP